MVTFNDVRSVALKLPRSYEVVVRRRVKFRVGQIVYLSFSEDRATMGFAFPKDQREWLVGGSPGKFMLPGPSDMRYHWALARLDALGRREMRELVEDAWRMVVPKSVAAAYAARAKSLRRAFRESPAPPPSLERAAPSGPESCAPPP